MTEWEDNAAKVFQVPREDPIHEPIRVGLRDILNEYCTPGAKVRGYEVEMPPTYSMMSIESVEEESPDRVAITARSTKGGLDDLYTFILKKTNDKWLLSDRLYHSFNGKLKKYYF